MSRQGDLARLESILKYANDIERIVERHQTIENALSDFEGQYAIMMCFQQIGELANQIQTKAFKAVLPIKEMVGFRNIIAHHYDGISFRITHDAIASNIPQLIVVVKKLLADSRSA